MRDVYETLLFLEALTPAQEQALRRALAEDPALARAWARWRQLRGALRARLDAHVPDRSLLVCYALAEGGYADVLSPAEQDTLEDARPALARALDAYPALADVVRRIQAECADFEALWNEHVEEARQPLARPAADRRARPPAARASTASRNGLRWAWRAAAVAAVVAFGAVALLVLQRDSRLTTVQTAMGEVRLIALADGSTVRLMENSTLAYAEPGAASTFDRRARLSGKAFFDITPSQQGFTVETEMAYTTVLGTEFGVQAGERITEVVLATGKVSLAPKAARDQIVVLEPGQMSRVTANALPSTPAPVDVAAALDWTHLFVFRRTPLDQVAARLSRHYGVEVALDPSLEGQEVNGTFGQEQALEKVLSTLAATLGADVEPLPGGGYRLTTSQ